MTKHSLNKMLYEAALTKAIKDLQTSPEQTLKHWVEKGSAKVQKGEQAELLERFRPLLNEQGAYFSLIRRLVAEVQADRLKTLALNFAYYAFKFGAEIRKEQELRYGVHIPFTVFFELDGTVTVGHVKSIVEQGKKLGIYTYQLFCRTERALAALPELFSAQEDCVFMVYLRPEAVTKALVDDWRRYQQVMPILLTRGLQGKEALTLFRAAGILCGSCLEYDVNTKRSIDTSEYLTQAARSGAPFVALWPQRGVAPAMLSEVAKTVSRQRLAQTLPVIPFDLLGDIMEADRILSNESALLYFDAKGQRICIEAGYLEGDENLFHNTFIQILEAL